MRMAHHVISLHTRNADHFQRWDPPRPDGYWSVEATKARLEQELLAFNSGWSWRYWISEVGSSAIIGQCQISGVQRGPFQSAALGYSLDRRVQGQGLMTEALSKLIALIFAPDARLHRLQAAVRPENERSRRVLQRLGFIREGYAPSYLFIDGEWRDHEIFSIINGAWPREEAPT